MDLAQAQAQVRYAYLDGSVGQIYAGLVWLGSVVLWISASRAVGIWVLLVGGSLIYPVTTAVCRLLGRPGSILAGNPLRMAGWTIPLVGALLLPLIGAAALYEENWFYPAFMIGIGAHYLPFSHLYGNRWFLALGGGMWATGFVLGVWFRDIAVLGAWATAVALLAFGAAHWPRADAVPAGGG